MGCAGSNPLPSGDTMAAANGRAADVVNAPLQMAADNKDKTCSIVQKMVENVSNVSINDMVKKIQDVSGSMENLMDGTQEKLGSLFGKVEQKAEDLKQTVNEKLNDSNSTVPEKCEAILDTVEETRIIPIDEVTLENLKNEITNDEMNEEQIINKNQNEEEKNVEEEKVEEEKVEEKVEDEDKIKEEENEE